MEMEEKVELKKKEVPGKVIFYLRRGKKVIEYVGSMSEEEMHLMQNEPLRLNDEQQAKAMKILEVIRLYG